MVITTGGAVMSVRTQIGSDRSLRIGFTLDRTAADGRATEAHLTFIRYPDCPIRFSDGSSSELGENAFMRTGLDSVQYQNWSLSLPTSARVTWPVLPHNPYTGDGHALITEGRLVVSLPLEREGDEAQLVLTVAGD